MTEDLKILLDDASSSGSPPMRFSAEDVVAKGRARGQRRTVFASTGLAVVTAVAVGAGLMLNGSGGGAPAMAGPSASASSEPTSMPDFPPPEPGNLWNSLWDKRDATGDTITPAVVGYLMARFPNMKTVLADEPKPPNYNSALSMVDLDDPQSPLRFDRYRAALTSDPLIGLLPLENNFPIYRESDGTSWRTPETMTWGDPTAGTDGWRLSIEGNGKKKMESLGVSVFPANSYVAGYDDSEDGWNHTTGGHLISGCATKTRPGAHGGGPMTATFVCTEKTGPNGERILTAKRTMTWDSYSSVDLSVVVYRADGTAVVVRSSGDKPIGWTQRSQSKFDMSAGFTVGDLSGIGLAVPQVTF